jgi:hypothetical protein
MCKHEKVIKALQAEIEASLAEYRREARMTNVSSTLAGRVVLEAIRDKIYELLAEYKRYEGELVDTRSIHNRFIVSSALLNYHVKAGHLKIVKGKGRRRLFDAEKVEDWASRYNFPVKQ